MKSENCTAGNSPATIKYPFRAGAGVCIMTPALFETCKQAFVEMRATDAAVIVFEHGGRWYEINHNRHRPKPVCGARKKTGERCRSKSLHRGGKCKFHGGLSTGARTPEGKARAIAAMQKGKAKWLSEQYAQARGRVKTA